MVNHEKQGKRVKPNEKLLIYTYDSKNVSFPFFSCLVLKIYEESGKQGPGGKITSEKQSQGCTLLQESISTQCSAVLAEGLHISKKKREPSYRQETACIIRKIKIQRSCSCPSLEYFCILYLMSFKNHSENILWFNWILLFECFPEPFILPMMGRVSLITQLR